ncbi:hypothetical protein [Alkalimonas mucilaginosa]|uniref:Uncharacterized protein n=1 Tax=Alkalimonas mucilaginosa TaxID=3057676 RepID=A0ABU7JJN4_9GAMM|nr:hypothetical protein [Alkalimonas sp. MEB004]MEE2025548.1 hypothetical protein [Alkalimonas sp. MEB004]
MQTALIERRQSNRETQQIWDELNLAQKFSVAELQRYGYQLAFVRHSTTGNLAVLLAGNRIAAIDQDGEIDTEPKITVRH